MFISSVQFNRCEESFADANLEADEAFNFSSICMCVAHVCVKGGEN